MTTHDHTWQRHKANRKRLSYTPDVSTLSADQRMQNHRRSCEISNQLARIKAALQVERQAIVNLIGQAVGRGIDIAQLAQMTAKANEPRKVLFVDFTPEDTQPIPPHHGLYLVPKKYRDVAEEALEELIA